jgi:hypothetical protein
MSATAEAKAKKAALAAWEAEQRAWLQYSAEGPPPTFTRIAPGESLDQFVRAGYAYVPKLVEHGTGTGLYQAVAVLMIDWSYGVAGPTTYSLGHPKVTLTSPTSAIIVTCASTDGWTVPSIPPPFGMTAWPTSSQILSRSFMVQEGGIWKQTGGQHKKGVTKC